MSEHTEYPLAIRRFATRSEMGRAAAADIADFLCAKIGISGRRVRVIFASADSQRDMLESLVADHRIDWGRITAFHMDEYVGLDPDAPQRLGNWLKRTLIERVPIERFHAISPELGVMPAIESYWRLLMEGPIDAVCLGIGVNGHLAFNEPGADTNLEDRRLVREIGLDPVSCRQQVDEGNFPSMETVPKHAITPHGPVPPLGRAALLRRAGQSEGTRGPARPPRPDRAGLSRDRSPPPSPLYSLLRRGCAPAGVAACQSCRK